MNKILYDRERREMRNRRIKERARAAYKRRQMDDSSESEES